MDYELISKFSSVSKDGKRTMEMVVVRMKGAACIISKDEYTSIRTGSRERK